VAKVNELGMGEWYMVGCAVQTMIGDLNLKKAGKKIPEYDYKPMDEEGRCIVENWVASKV
jgi:hypothetical protein